MFVVRYSKCVASTEGRLYYLLRLGSFSIFLTCLSDAFLDSSGPNTIPLLIVWQLGKTLKPFGEFGIFLRINGCDFIDRRDRSYAAQIGYGQFVAAQILAVLQKSLHDRPLRLQILDFLLGQLSRFVIENRLVQETQATE